jgi:hypothetical protein
MVNWASEVKGVQGSGEDARDACCAIAACRQQTPYSKDSDFVFPSFKLHGKQPRLGSMIVQDYIRPAAVSAE